jgi:hypothetical protein
MTWDSVKDFEHSMKWHLEIALDAKKLVETEDAGLSDIEKTRAARHAVDVIDQLSPIIEWAYDLLTIESATPAHRSPARQWAQARERIAERIFLAQDCLLPRESPACDRNQSVVVVLKREDAQELLAAMRSANCGHARPLIVPYVTGQKGDRATVAEARAWLLELVEFRCHRHPKLSRRRVIEEPANAFGLSPRTVMRMLPDPERWPDVRKLDDRLERARAAGDLKFLYDVMAAGTEGEESEIEDACYARIVRLIGHPNEDESDADQSAGDAVADINVDVRNRYRDDFDTRFIDLHHKADELAESKILSKKAEEHRGAMTAYTKTRPT